MSTRALDHGTKKSEKTYDVELTIHSAKHLPKADLIGKIDAYFIVTDGVHKAVKTPVITSYDPVHNWSSTFKGLEPTDKFFIALWDEDSMSSDEQVGLVKTPFPLEGAERIELPIELTKGFKSKDGGVATIVISFNVKEVKE